MNPLERLGVQRLVDQAAELGVAVPAEIRALLADAHVRVSGAVLWVRAHPNDEGTGCCWGDIARGPEHCACWVPEWNADQAEPILPPDPADFGPRPAMCGDCAFKPGSAERRDQWMADALYDLAASAKPFYCHDGMRRPVRWRHPDGRVIDGSPDDWQPPNVNGVPFRLDGRPGLLCAGWAVAMRRAKADAR